jgi:hypothetical protein
MDDSIFWHMNVMVNMKLWEKNALWSNLRYIYVIVIYIYINISVCVCVRVCAVFDTYRTLVVMLLLLEL